jgi:hypothetical protein
VRALRRAWALAKHALAFEIRIYVSLARWLTRRPSVPAGFEPVPYARLVTPMMALWIFGSALEVPLVHVLVPWEIARVALLAVGIWGLVWMLGALGGLRSYPHLAGAEVLRVRNGGLHDITVPWVAVARVRTGDQSLPSTVWALQPQAKSDGTHLNLAVSGRVNVHLSFREPLALRTQKGTIAATGISFWADEPGEAASRARRHVDSNRNAENR